MKANVVIIIELLMFFHPVCELLELDGPSVDIDAVAFENISGIALDDVVNAGSFDFDIMLAELVSSTKLWPSQKNRIQRCRAKRKVVLPGCMSNSSIRLLMAE